MSINDSFKKIILGTASFGNKYGLNNYDYVEQQESDEIINYFIQNGGIEIDTAMNYGLSENIVASSLKNLNSKKIIVTSKFNLENEFNLKSFMNQIRSTNDKFEGRLKYLLCHKADIVKLKLENILLKAFDLIKSEFGIKVGISIYNLKEFEKLDDKLKREINYIQAPLNIYDETANLLKNKNKNLEFKVAARSIFLQGFLISSKCPNNIFKAEWENFQKTCRNQDIEPKIACLSHAISKNKIDKLVLGVNSFEQIEELSNILYSLNKTDFKFDISSKYLGKISSKLIDPREW